MQTVLEFGCGCGRVIRYWNSLKGPELHGIDYNPKLIEWCRQNLPFAKFDINRLYPPLPYADERFDFIYAISVFTHLSEDLQCLWIKELSRVLKTDGYLLITTHGKDYIHKLTKREREEFIDGKLIVRYAEASGTNLCVTYHPEMYVQTLTNGYSMIDYVPAETESTFSQELYLLRKDRVIDA